MNKTQGNNAGLSTSRFEAFSDGVFAIAITLLVLEISVPEGAGEHLLSALWHEWPSYLAYIVSFSTIGAIWFAHNVITECLDKVDRNLVRINLLLLMMVSFLPFPTKLLAAFIGETDSGRVAVTFYGIVLVCTALLLSLLWRYAVHNKLTRNDIKAAEIDRISDRLNPSLLGYLIFILIGLFFPLVSVIGYLIVAFLILFPILTLRNLLRKL